jgi:Thioredoxin like C-terminal domain/AhpC/TSA family
MESRLFHSSVRIPSFDGATGWLNSEPLTAEDLSGQVVLVNFCTFTCINWIRQLPYVRAWADKYGDQGLVVVGAHTPEFTVEHDFESIRRALAAMRVEHPIAIDNDYAVWDAFANRYWPALYVADADGALRYQHFGEGRYEESERAIQELLGVDDELVSVEGVGIEAPADWDELESPETYVGYGQGERFASPGGGAADERRSYSMPEMLRSNHWALEGEWTIQREGALLHEAGGRLAFRFHARDLHLVMAPPEGAAMPVRVLLDGKPPGDACGSDIDEQGNGVVAATRLYQLIRQPGSIDDRTFEITFLEPGAQALVFTFG